VSTPRIGESYRGVKGRSGYLLSQTWLQFRGAMEAALRAHGLIGPQYAVLSVLGRDPGMSGPDLARACHTTPQAMNWRPWSATGSSNPHPTHGRILQVTLTPEWERRLEAATPAVRELERTIERGLAPEQIAAVKAWLVASAQRMEEKFRRAGNSGRPRPGPREPWRLFMTVSGNSPGPADAACGRGRNRQPPPPPPSPSSAGIARAAAISRAARRPGSAAPAMAPASDSAAVTAVAGPKPSRKASLDA
jgi:DNA-binding MarR family transcriptional regulator